MPSIGILANPASGKDIRRLVSYATTIDNQEKVNIVKRIVLAAQSLGVDTVWFMPDTFQIGWAVIDDLTRDEKLTAQCRFLDVPLTASSADTTAAAAELERMGVDCAVVLGGDGTSRAAAKGLNRTPLLPLSTGTNNVYPSMIEGTVAGMAAAAVARAQDPYACCLRDKRIEIARNGTFTDLALIDAVVTDDLWVGSRAIWDVEKLRNIFVTRCHPASIGFSAAAGCLETVSDMDERGLALDLGQPGQSILAPVAAGVLSSLSVRAVRSMPVGVPVTLPVENGCMVALDGERELQARSGDTLTFTVTRNGPWRVRFRRALELAVQQGLFRPDVYGTQA